MMPTPEQELALAKEEYERAKAQAKARFDQAKARHTNNARKLDTRRKIVAGGALFELASRDIEAALVLERILDGITRDVDRKAFDGWERPQESEKNGSGQNVPSPDRSDAGSNDRGHSPFGETQP